MTSTQNTIIAAVALTLTLTTVPVILHANLKLPIKASLLNLSANNLMISVSGLVLSAWIQPHYRSHDLSCQYIIHVIAYCYLLMHVAVLGISLNNFCALSYPFIYRTLTKWKLATVTSLAVWAGMGVVHVSISRGGSAQQDQICHAYSVLPRHWLVSTSLLKFLIDANVILFNVKVFRKFLALKTKVAVSNNNSNNSNNNRQRRNFGLEEEGNCSFAELGGEYVANDESTDDIRPSAVAHSTSNILTAESHPPQSTTDISACSPAAGLPKSFPHSHTRKSRRSEKVPTGNVTGVTFRYTTDSQSETDDLDVIQEEVVPPKNDNNKANHHISPKCYSSLQTITAKLELSRREVKQPPEEEIPCTYEYNFWDGIIMTIDFDQQTRRNFGAASSTGDNSSPPPPPSSSQDVTSARGTTHNASIHYTRMTKQSTTLVTISLFTFVLNSPLNVYNLYLGMSVYKDSDHMNPVQQMAMALNVVTVLGQPFIYAWRFIHWREVLSGLRCKST